VTVFLVHIALKVLVLLVKCKFLNIFLQKSNSRASAVDDENSPHILASRAMENHQLSIKCLKAHFAVMQTMKENIKLKKAILRPMQKVSLFFASFLQT
jgi:hypothetical protein